MPTTKTCPRCGDAYDDSVDFCAKDGTRLVRGGQVGDLIGTVIADRYRIVSRIGEGGMGQVYLAEHVRMKRKSAIKIMRPALVGEVEALQRFTREAENASQLSHPNIAAIFDFGETADGIVYLAMEYIDGESLAELLEREQALHPDIAADIIGQAADALQAAHDMQMLHRDIKPDNIMLGRRADGTFQVKLVDFGIARSMDGRDQKVTRTGFAIGTPQYMSPEQLAGDLLDTASDQYSLALVAYYALTGKQAFSAESSKESLIQRLTSRPPSLQVAKDDVEWPEALQAVFDRALAPEPRERFDTMSEFARAFYGAISSMTPTQTAEIYRHALNVRVANVTARTPHAEREALLTGSGSRATLGGTGTTRSTATLGDGSDATSASSVRASANTGTTPPAARWPFVIGGVVALTAVATFLMTRPGARNGATPATPAGTSPAGDTSQRTRVGPAVGKAGSPAAGPTSANGAPSGNAPPNGDGKALLDSVKRAAALKARATADSIARVKRARLRYPDAALRSVLARGIDAKARMTRNDDVRVNIMPTPIFIWRSEQGHAWKVDHPKTSGTGTDLVDPMEAWSAWASLVSSQRAVYVLEVTPDKTPWPTFAPDKLFDIKRGDVAGVELLRDGAPVALESPSHIAAVANAAEHQAAAKPVPHAFVAMASPATFVPRDDGSWPKIEIVVHDAMRNDAIVKLTLSESLVRRLYDDFAPWRDAMARP